MNTRVTGASVLEFPRRTDGRGDLAFLEGLRHVPFAIQATYWWTGAPRRGGSASPARDEVLLALTGHFEVQLAGAEGAGMRVVLDRPDRGLLVPRLTWWEVLAASPDAVGIAVCSEPLEDGETVRDRARFDALVVLARGRR